MTVKEEVRDVLQTIPDDATWDDLREALEVRRLIRERCAELEAGKTVSTAEARERMSRWLSE